MADFAALFWVLPFFLALLAYEGKALTVTGGITAILVAYLILFTQGISWFLIMFVFFIVASAATRFKEKRKARMDLVQKVRGPSHIIANGGISILGALAGNPYLFLGSIATSLSDTMSSEIGILSKGKPVMITTLKKAKTGVNGAVSNLGNAVALLSAIGVGLMGLTITGDANIVWITAAAGFAGMLMDSLLGALLENQGKIGNNTTNLLSSLFGGLFAVAISLFI